jgi:hypothetical protein
VNIMTHLHVHGTVVLRNEISMLLFFVSVIYASNFQRIV